MKSHESSKSDQELVVETLQDRNVFAVLVSRYERALRRYITRLGSGDSEVTEDILQESFIKAYLNLNDYDLSLSFSAWLYRITHNETVNHFRKQKNRPRTMEKEEDLELFEKIADELNIEEQADLTRARASIQKALGTLEEHYRDVLILRFFEEKSYDEISDILEIPSGTVATYLSRAKEKLKQALKRSGMNDV